MANTYKYTDVVGPAWVDGTTGHTATFNIQALGADRTYTFPNAAGTVALTTSGGDFLPSVDATQNLGSSALRWDGVILDDTGSIIFDDGAGGQNIFAYADGQGPTFTDHTHGGQLAFIISGLTIPRSVTWPNASGTVTLLGNTATGTGSVVLAASPTLTGTLTAADVAASGDVKITTAGKGLYVKEGSNATMGIATLVLGTVVVATNKVTATSRIQLTAQTLGTVAVPQALAVSARTASTSFTILSSDLTDTSTVAWMIVEPA